MSASRSKRTPPPTPERLREIAEHVRSLGAHTHAEEIALAADEIAGYHRWESSINEALNSGDGSYRP